MLILRNNINSRLTSTQLDDNFTYLESISGGTSSGGATGPQGTQGPQGPAGSGGSGATFSLLTTVDYTDLNAGTVSSVVVTIIEGKPANKYITRSILQTTTAFVSASASAIGTIIISTDNNDYTDTILLSSVNSVEGMLSSTMSLIGQTEQVSQLNIATDVDITFTSFTGNVNPNDWSAGETELWVMYEDMPT